MLSKLMKINRQQIVFKNYTGLETQRKDFQFELESLKQASQGCATPA